MPVTIPLDTEMERRAKELYVPGEFGYRRVAEALGCSATTVRRYVKPGAREENRRMSLAAKRRRTGICERCGGVTHYNGRTINGASTVCDKCSHEPWTHCINGHELTPEIDLRPQKNGWTCRICRNDYMREFTYRKRREAGIPERGPYISRRLSLGNKTS